MKAVVDTNVVAYLLLGTEAFIDEARACFETITDPSLQLTGKPS
jgi:predicted nucleic acid-binding protein